MRNPKAFSCNFESAMPMAPLSEDMSSWYAASSPGSDEDLYDDQWSSECEDTRPDTTTNFGSTTSTTRRTKDGRIEVTMQGRLPSQGWVDMLQALEQRNIPVPHVERYNLDPTKGPTYITTANEDGFLLSEVWDLISDESKQEVVRELKGIWERLRTITFDDLVPMPVCDRFFYPRCEEEYGPYPTSGAFIKALIQRIEAVQYDTVRTASVVQFLRYLDSDGPTVFTHGDFCAQNILVDADLKVIAILDWSQAGFYPPYWEYVKAKFWDEDSSFVQEGAVEGILRPNAEPWPIHLAILLHARDLIW